MSKNIWKNVLLTLLVLQAVVVFLIGMYALMDFPSLLQQLGIVYKLNIGILQPIIVYSASIAFSMCLWSVLWIRKNNLAGIQAGTTLGLLLFVFGLVVFIRFDRVEILLFDSIRGALMAVAGFLAYKKHTKIN